MARVAGVRFKTAGKVYYFDPADLNVKAGDNVIVETATTCERKSQTHRIRFNN